MTADTKLRIGELSKRSGVSPELLRAWERRYGLLDPVRTAGGLRLYSLGDLERVRLMQQHLASGLAAAEAAAQVAQREPGLIAFGLALRARGWRIAYLGSDTPLEEIERVGANDPDLIVLCAVVRRRIQSAEAGIRTLAERRRVALGGAGAREEDAK